MDRCSEFSCKQTVLIRNRCKHIITPKKTVLFFFLLYLGSDPIQKVASVNAKV